MSLIGIGLKMGGDDSDYSVNSWTHRYRYLAESNNRYDTPTSIFFDRLVPQIGTIDRYSNNAVITNVKPKRSSESNFLWDIEVTASSLDADNPAINPLDEPAIIVPFSEQTTELTYRDRENKWIRNKAGTIIPVQRKVSNWIFSVKKNLPFLPDYMMEMNNTINSGFVYLSQLPIPRRRLMVFGVKGDPKSKTLTNGKLDYMQVSFKLLYNRNEFKVKYPNADIVQLDYTQVPLYERGPNNIQQPVRDSKGRPRFEVVKTRIPILDENKEKRTEPWPLDDQGRALPANYSFNDLIELEAEIYEEKSFSLLPLD